jgi:hypothetical protein
MARQSEGLHWAPIELGEKSRAVKSSAVERPESSQYRHDRYFIKKICFLGLNPTEANAMTLSNLVNADAFNYGTTDILNHSDYVIDGKSDK